VALLELLNFDPEIDLKMLEAMKVLMMLEAIDMHKVFTGGVQAPTNKPPVFVWLMYSRQSSQSPEALFTNHINPLGDVHPAHQVGQRSNSIRGHRSWVKIIGHTSEVKQNVIRGHGSRLEVIMVTQCHIRGHLMSKVCGLSLNFGDKITSLLYEAVCKPVLMFVPGTIVLCFACRWSCSCWVILWA
jgi:hypothetical protein